MFEGLKKVKEMTKDKKGRRKIENLGIILILGVIIIIVASSFFDDGGGTSRQNEKEETSFPVTNPPDGTMTMEERLGQILSEIEGAGVVKVMITQISDGEVVHAYNQKEERRIQEEQNSEESFGKTEEIKLEQELVFIDSGSGIRAPVVIERMSPAIQGVVVVADGAGSSAVCRNITSAVEALTGIPAHRIQVLKRK